MSVKDAHRFYEHTLKNKKLFDAVKQTREQVIHLAKTHGYNFSYDELSRALAQRWGADYNKDNPNPDKPLFCCCF